ncbi:hypothetical protein GCM10020219_042510 [Nonomuraea dietziae]
MRCRVSGHGSGRVRTAAARVSERSPHGSIALTSATGLAGHVLKLLQGVFARAAKADYVEGDDATAPSYRKRCQVKVIKDRLGIWSASMAAHTHCKNSRHC